MVNPWNRQAAEVQTQATTAVDQGLRSYMLRIYNYMASGVLLTGLVAWFASNSQPFLRAVMSFNEAGQATGLSPVGWLIAFAPVIFVLVLGMRMRSMSVAGLQLAFWGYAGVMGLSLFSIFLVYTGASIIKVFFITAATFGILSIYGYTTKKDMTSWGSFLFAGIWAVFFASLANIFLFKSGGFDLVLSLVGVVLAIGLTAYNTQQIKEIYYHAGRNSEALQRAGIMGALQLYFDFIYLFINLLRLMGDRR